jgi:hypothetical protein
MLTVQTVSIFVACMALTWIAVTAFAAIYFNRNGGHL